MNDQPDLIRERIPALDRIADQFQPPLKQTARLELQKEALLRLRARGATCPQIRRILGDNGIQVTEAVLYYFFQKYTVELRRLRAERQPVRDETGAFPITVPIDPPLTQSSTPNPTGYQPRKFRSLRGPV